MTILDPRMSQTLSESPKRAQKRIHTSTICKVIKYYSTGPEAGTVDVQPLVHLPGEEPDAPVLGIPVVWEASAIFRVAFGLKPGDEGILIYHELDPSEGWRNNSVAAVVNQRLHGRYGEFIPRRASDVTVWQGLYPDENELVIGTTNESVEIKIHSDGTVSIKATKIKLGSDAVSLPDHVATANKTDADIAILKSAVVAGFNALVGAPAGPIGAPAVAAFNAAATTLGTASAKVEIDS
jgi:hypothetical protein